MDEFVRKWSSQLKKGTLTFIVLSILRNGEFYGYELIEEVKRNMQIEIAEGTLYPLLTRLKNAELIQSDWRERNHGIPRKYYTITEKGKKSLSEMANIWLTMNMNLQKLLMKRPYDNK